MENRVDRHHIFWPRREQKTSMGKRLRNMGAFIVNGEVENHRKLHANVLPPPPLKLEEMRDLYSFMRDRIYRDHTLEGVEWAIVWGEDSGVLGFADNLREQHYYLSGDWRDSL